jgi:trehalose 6-phosphate phosphatase
MKIALPPRARAAFLLDLDGTLIDIAPTPDAVVVPDGLLDSLRALRDLCGGALAIVTGRTLKDVDALLADAPTAVAAEHGTSLRHHPGEAPDTQGIDDPPPAWLDQASRLTEVHPGTCLEHKRHGFVVHYRGAPDAGTATEQALRAMIVNKADEFVLLAAKMAWEVRPAGIDKGFAVRAIMQRAPFAGRLPIFIGDDVTDEDGIAAAESLGGIGLRVADAFGEPGNVRDWLGRLATGSEAWHDE